MNEEFGHLAGDAVLSQVGSRVRRRLRQEDLLARYGGGEFAVLCPEATQEAMEDMTARIQDIVRAGTFGFDDVQIPVQITTGFACLNELEGHDDGGFFTRTATVEAEVSGGGPASDISTTPEANAHLHMELANELMDLARERMTRAKRAQLQADGRRSSQP